MSYFFRDFFEICTSIELKCIIKLQGITHQMSRPMQLKPGEPDKINAVLTDFCRICVSAVFNNPDIQVRLADWCAICSQLYYIVHVS